MSHLARRSTERRKRAASAGEASQDYTNHKETRAANPAYPAHTISSLRNNPHHGARPLDTGKKVYASTKIKVQVSSQRSPSRTLSMPTRSMSRRLAVAPNATTSKASIGANNNSIKQPRRSVSISDCLTALRHRQDGEIDSSQANGKAYAGAPKSVAGEDSVGDMPSLVSYGQLSTFSRQSYSSGGSGFSLSSSSVDVSLASSEPPTSVMSSATKSLSLPSIQDDSRDDSKDGSTSSSRFDSRRPKTLAANQTLESALSTSGCQQRHPLPLPPCDESPIQIVTVKRLGNSLITHGKPQQQQQHQQKNQHQYRSLLKHSAKDYRPDVLPRREMRWKTTEENSNNTLASKSVGWNRIHRPLQRSDSSSEASAGSGSNSSRSTTSSTTTDIDKKNNSSTNMMIRPPRRRMSSSSNSHQYYADEEHQHQQHHPCRETPPLSCVSP